ncbi:hypothetical protein GH714_001556 [Hevea brasiliensis]|uniref:Uncharacterized protein n=1 Tax=Hevea brasiliensis TaxID=3981 RepID=A0A6A6M9Y0_HEVBR|nr:hypothetical protein GH714_001556 [Hevea brasiliensis]
MERNPNNITTERSDTHKQYQYNAREPGREGFHPACQAFLIDPTSSRNTNVRLRDLNVSEVKPVLNFSIQTGEEFALEFMCDRVHRRRPPIPNAFSDPNHAPGYMELKGILGASHTGSGGTILPCPSDGKLRYFGGETRIISISGDISWEELKQKTLAILEGDSEIQYVVAVNGMDPGSRKNSIVHGLASSLGNNLNELDRLIIDTETSGVATVSVDVSTSPLTSNFHSAQPILQNSSSAYETHPQLYHGQMMDHREAQQFLAQYPNNSSNHSPSEEIPYSTSVHGFMNQQGGLNGGKSCSSFLGQNSEALIKEAKQKPEGSVWHEVGIEKKLIPKKRLFQFELPQPSVTPQRVYYSERIPRDQAEVMNSLSKSDDSLGSQFLISHSHSDISEQKTITESAEKFIQSNLDLHTEHPVPTAKPLHLRIDPQQINNGLAQLQKYKEFANAVSRMNKSLSDSQDILQNGFKLAAPNHVDDKDSGNRDAMLKADHDHTVGNQKKFLVDETGESGSWNPAASQATSIVHLKDPVTDLPGPKLGEIAGKDFASNNLGHS